MKKIISVILCISLVVGIFAFTASAESELPIKGEITDYPVVIVPGYSAAWLMLGDDPETAECAWSGLDLNLLLPKLLDHIAELGLGLAVMNLDNAKLIAKVVAEEIPAATIPVSRTMPMIFGMTFIALQIMTLDAGSIPGLICLINTADIITVSM